MHEIKGEKKPKFPNQNEKEKGEEIKKTIHDCKQQIENEFLSDACWCVGSSSRSRKR